MKNRLLQLVLLLMPLAMLVAAFGLDILEAQMGRKFGPVNTETYIWSLVWIRIVFAVAAFSVAAVFIRIKKIAWFADLVWLVLGLAAVFLATPWGNYIRSTLVHNPILATFPNRLFFMAGAFVFLGGGLRLLELAFHPRKAQ